MHNIVNLGSERQRPRRRAGMPGDGARILFFTGVRYCRESDDNASSHLRSDQADRGAGAAIGSGLALALAAH